MGRKEGKNKGSKQSGSKVKPQQSNPLKQVSNEPSPEPIEPPKQEEASTSSSVVVESEIKRETKRSPKERLVQDELKKRLQKANIKDTNARDRCIEKLINCLQAPRNEDTKEKYIERLVNSISDLLKLDEASDGNDPEERRERESFWPPKPAKEEETKDQFCAFCKAVSKTRCTGCHLVFYCGRDCQRKDWKTHKDSCRPYTIAKSKDGGRVLVASRELTAGDAVLLESPLVLGPRSGQGSVCLTCSRKLFSEQRCSKCGLPVCCKRCEGGQHAANECQIAQAAKVKSDLIQNEVPDRLFDAITSFRCLLVRKKESKRWETTMERFNVEFLRLIGASDNNADQRDILKESLKIHLHSDLVSITDSEIHEVLGLLQIHYVPTKLPYGEMQGIYPLASLLSHSCIPNTKLIWHKGMEKLKVTATEVIPRGTPLTISYSDILWGTRARRDHLQQTRMISCSCRRCKDPTELGTFFSALLCRRCPKKMSVLPIDPLNNGSPWACQQCEQQISSAEVLQETLALGAAVSQNLQSPSVESSEALLKEWGQRMHSNHYHFHALKHSLLQLYGREQEKVEEKNDRHWEEVGRKEVTCKEFLRVCALLDPALTATTPYVGVTFFEYHKTILQNAKRAFAMAKISTVQLRKRMLLSKELLRKAMDIFRDEPEDTPEGQLYGTCQEEIIAIGKWMLAVGLV